MREGFKAHAELGGFARWGIEVMRSAARIAREAELPLYIHFGQLWPLPEGSNVVHMDPDRVLADVVPLIKPGDVLAHPYSRHPGSFVDQSARVNPLAKAAIERGWRTRVRA